MCVVIMLQFGIENKNIPPTAANKTLIRSSSDLVSAVLFYLFRKRRIYLFVRFIFFSFSIM